MSIPSTSSRMAVGRATSTPLHQRIAGMFGRRLSAASNSAQRPALFVPGDVASEIAKRLRHPRDLLNWSLTSKENYYALTHERAAAHASSQAQKALSLSAYKTALAGLKTKPNGDFFPAVDHWAKRTLNVLSGRLRLLPPDERIQARREILDNILRLSPASQAACLACLAWRTRGLEKEDRLAHFMAVLDAADRLRNFMTLQEASDLLVCSCQQTVLVALAASVVRLYKHDRLDQFIGIVDRIRCLLPPYQGLPLVTLIGQIKDLPAPHRLEHFCLAQRLAATLPDDTRAAALTALAGAISALPFSEEMLEYICVLRASSALPLQARLDMLMAWVDVRRLPRPDRLTGMRELLEAVREIPAADRAFPLFALCMQLIDLSLGDMAQGLRVLATESAAVPLLRRCILWGVLIFLHFSVVGAIAAVPLLAVMVHLCF